MCFSLYPFIRKGMDQDSDDASGDDSNSTSSRSCSRSCGSSDSSQDDAESERGGYEDYEGDRREMHDMKHQGGKVTVDARTGARGLREVCTLGQRGKVVCDSQVRFWDTGLR